MLFTKGYLKQGPRPHNVQPKGGTVIVPNSTSSLKTMDCSPPPKLFNLQNEKKKKIPICFPLSGCTCVVSGLITSNVTSVSRDKLQQREVRGGEKWNFKNVSLTYRILNKRQKWPRQACSLISYKTTTTTKDANGDRRPRIYWAQKEGPPPPWQTLKQCSRLGLFSVEGGGCSCETPFCFSIP